MQEDERELRDRGGAAARTPRSRAHPRRPRVARDTGRAGCCRLFVDKPGGVRVEDCQRVSRELGDVLDAAGLIEEAYDLEVSSPGLDRQLRKDRELRWAVGKRVRCWLAGGEELHGRLVDVGRRRAHPGSRWERDVELPRDGSRRPVWTWRFRGRDGRQDYEPRTDHGHRAAGPGEGDRQRGPLRGAGVCPAVGLAEDHWARPTTCGSRSTARPASSAPTPARRSSTEVTDPKLEISLAEAKALNPEAELDDELDQEQERPPQDFGRIAAQTAKQVILQKVRDAEREGIYSEFAGKEGTDPARRSCTASRSAT